MTTGKKPNETTAREIRAKRAKQNLTYEALASVYELPVWVVKDICKYYMRAGVEV